MAKVTITIEDDPNDADAVNVKTEFEPALDFRKGSTTLTCAQAAGYELLNLIRDKSGSVTPRRRKAR